MDQKFTVPGREGWEANQSIAQRFGGTGGDAAPLVPVVTLAAGKRASDPDVRRDLAALERRLTKALPGARIARRRRRSGGFSSADGRTTFARGVPEARPDAAVRREPEGRDSPRAPRCAA